MTGTVAARALFAPKREPPPLPEKHLTSRKTGLKYREIRELAPT
jgi:hypothetical protein